MRAAVQSRYLAGVMASTATSIDRDVTTPPRAAMSAIPRPARPPVRRPRVSRLLAGTLDARLTLLSAPPGFGKTTALADWLVTSGVRAAWITLDERDNDPMRFLRSLSAGVLALAGSAGSDARFQPAVVDPLGAIVEVPSVLAAQREPSVIALDDYHLVTSRDVQRAVGLMLDRLPGAVHVVIATRADPALPLARLRARGELLEVRADALRFTIDEARDFFAERIGLALSDEDLRVLLARTEGWPAVLQLAGLALAARHDVTEGIRTFAATHRFVLDYVTEEVLASVSGDTQRFLLRTSILERLSGPLCEAVTGEPGGQERLEALERANLLIVPLDDERRWYRYHQLLADVLRARLRAADPGAVAALHARASTWFEAQGDDDSAIGHALASGDLDRTARLVAIASGSRLNAGEIATVRRWLDALPTDVVRSHAQLSATYAWCQLLAAETSGVAGRLDDAARALAAGTEAPDLAVGIPVQLAMLRSQLAGLQGDAAEAVAQARLAVQLVPDALPAPALANLRGTALSLLGVALWRQGELAAASDAYEAALPDLRASGNVLAAGRTVADLAAIAIAQGDAAGAATRCDAELTATDASPHRQSPAVWAALARARAELGEVEPARAAARRALDLATRAGDAPVARSAQETLARLDASGQTAPGTPARVTPTGLVEALTDRELEVLRLVALGRSNSQIARELFVTVGTVKSHVHAIAGKLGAANRVEAVARGRALGLIA